MAPLGAASNILGLLPAYEKPPASPGEFHSLKGGNLISVKGDTKYIAFLLLEVMYKHNKINDKTYQNIIRMKEQYLMR